MQDCFISAVWPGSSPDTSPTSGDPLVPTLINDNGSCVWPQPSTHQLSAAQGHGLPLTHQNQKLNLTTLGTVSWAGGQRAASAMTEPIYNTSLPLMGTSATPEADRRGGGRPREETSNQRHDKRRLVGRRRGDGEEHGFPATEAARCQSEPPRTSRPGEANLNGT